MRVATRVAAVIRQETSRSLARDDIIGASIAIEPTIDRSRRDTRGDGAGLRCARGFVRLALRHSPWGLSTFLINPRMPLSRSSAGEERGLVNSPDAMRSSRVLARHGVAARRRGSVTPAARPDPRNDSDPKPRIARPAPRLEREDADGATRARPSVGALPVASDDCITTGSGRARLSSKSPGA